MDGTGEADLFEARLPGEEDLAGRALEVLGERDLFLAPGEGAGGRPEGAGGEMRGFGDMRGFGEMRGW